MAAVTPPKVEYDFDVFSPEPIDDCDNLFSSHGTNGTNILNVEDERGVPSVVHESDEERFFCQDDQDDEQFFEDGLENDENEEVEGPQMCEDGILDEETIGNSLSNLGRSAEGTFQVYLNLKLAGMGVKDISALSEFVHLQKVDIPYNEITDLSPLGNLPYLLELDASHNQIDKLLDFNPPKNLKSVDLSFNNIAEMSDLSAHHYLANLYLDNNQISEVTGLQGCHRLSHLSLAHNKLQSIQGIENLPLSYLNMSSNSIKKIENLESLQYLQELNLSRNQIRSLNGLERLHFLETLDMEDNEIIDMLEIQHLKLLKLLRRFNLMGNPIQELPDYRLSVLFHIQHLTELDKQRADVEEKVAAKNTFNPPIEVVAARDHIMHVVYSFLQPNRIYESTLPSPETPYPMLVLAGPMGAGKKDLALKLVEEFPDYFGYGISNTTRKPAENEENGKDYNFCTVEEFENDVKMGKFLETYSYHGNLYGLTIDSIENVARDGLACVVHMELEGVLTLKSTHLEPRYVLITPLNRESHERRLKEKGAYSDSEIEYILERADIYAEYNRQHPGFFDMFINSDDITEAYKRLRRLVMDYLGIAIPSPSPSDMLEQSQTGSTLLEKEPTELVMTAGSANMGARTWSKPSIPDSAPPSVNPMTFKAMSPMPTSRGVVEAESLKRRQSAAKEAMAGHRPTIYEQIISRVSSTVPQPNSAHREEENQRSFSAPTTKQKDMDALPLSPDSSNSNSASKSSLSNISEAHLDDNDEANSSPASPKPAKNETGIDPLELSAGSGGITSLPSGQLAPRGSFPLEIPDMDNPETVRPASTSSGRLGSGRHRVLPPITSPQPASALPEV